MTNSTTYNITKYQKYFFDTENGSKSANKISKWSYRSQINLR